METIIDGRTLSMTLPAYIVAEIGINHNGDIDLAMEMIGAAKLSGCCAVKFQSYKTHTFIGKRAKTYTYQNHLGQEFTETQKTLFERCELKPGQLKSLKQHADKIGIGFHATPMDTEGVWELADLGVGVLKNGSDCLQDLELIRTMAETGLPTVISTGMASFDEINSAVMAYHDAGGEDLILLACTSAYPCQDRDANVMKMLGLQDEFECLVGYSDHTQGHIAAVMAAAYGAVWVEKHFTTDKTLPGPDQWFSANPEEMAKLVHNVRRAEAMRGKGDLEMTETEKANRKTWFK